MALRTISRAAVGGSIALARLPLDVLLRVAPGDGLGPAVGVALDRADATARSVAGTVLGDEELKADGRRRREAAAERGRAVRLRAEAERVSEEADERVAERQEQAERRRRGASKGSQRRRQGAAQRRESAKKEAAQATSRRKDEAQRSADRAEDDIEERAKRARLEQLETKTDALDTRERAQVVADEARRLRAAASGAKGERKNSG